MHEPDSGLGAYFNNFNRISRAYFNKTTSQHDIFIQYSKAASVTIPAVSTPASGQSLSFFSQTVPDLKKDVMVTLPAYSIPGSPFITRVRNDQGVAVTKSTPLK
jgi:hypothetical protein